MRILRFNSVIEREHNTTAVYEFQWQHQEGVNARSAVETFTPPNDNGYFKGYCRMKNNWNFARGSNWGFSHLV